MAQTCINLYPFPHYPENTTNCNFGDLWALLICLLQDPSLVYFTLRLYLLSSGFTPISMANNYFWWGSKDHCGARIEPGPIAWKDKSFVFYLINSLQSRKLHWLCFLWLGTCRKCITLIHFHLIWSSRVTSSFCLLSIDLRKIYTVEHKEHISTMFEKLKLLKLHFNHLNNLNVKLVLTIVSGTLTHLEI